VSTPEAGGAPGDAREIARKWRPTLGLITFAAIAAVLAAPLAGIVFFRLFEPHFADGDFILLPVAGFWSVFAVATLVFAAIVGAVFVRTLNRPIGQLVQRTEAIARGDRDAIRPLAHHGTRELAALTESFLAMAQRLSDRSDYIATFAAHVSHELKSPLTSIKGAAELLTDEGAGMTPEERERFLANIVADAARLTRLVERLRDLARADNPVRAGACTLGEIAPALRTAFKGLELRIEGALELPLAMSAENARIVLSNLFDNAMTHAARSVAVAAREDDGWLILVVADDGDGVSTSNREKIFEPFFTTRREDGGTGMGLAIVSAMLAAHRGTIRLLPTDKGASFEVRVPLEASGEHARPPPARGR
jgi:signal transduction histidine kinase